MACSLKYIGKSPQCLRKCTPSRQRTSGSLPGPAKRGSSEVMTSLASPLEPALLDHVTLVTPKCQKSSLSKPDPGPCTIATWNLECQAKHWSKAYPLDFLTPWIEVRIAKNIVGFRLMPYGMFQLHAGLHIAYQAKEHGQVETIVSRTTNCSKCTPLQARQTNALPKLFENHCKVGFKQGKTFMAKIQIYWYVLFLAEARVCDRKSGANMDGNHPWIELFSRRIWQVCHIHFIHASPACTAYCKTATRAPAAPTQKDASNDHHGQGVGAIELFGQMLRQTPNPTQSPYKDTVHKSFKNQANG